MPGVKGVSQRDVHQKTKCRNSQTYKTGNNQIVSPTFKVLAVGVLLDIELFEVHSTGFRTESILSTSKERIGRVSVVPLSVLSMSAFIISPQHLDHDISHGPAASFNLENLHPGIGMSQKVKIAVEMLDAKRLMELVI